MYNNVPPTVISGQQQQQFVYQGAQRVYMPPQQYYPGNNPYPPRGFARQNAPYPGLQHQSSISSNNTDSNTSPPSLSGTPAPVEPRLRQPCGAVYYNQQPPRIPYIQQMPPQQPFVFMQMPVPRLPNQPMRIRSPFISTPSYQGAPQNFPAVGVFQAPTDADGGHNYKGHYRKGKESSESNRQNDDRRQPNVKADTNVNLSENQKMQYQPSQQPFYQAQNASIVAQNPMFGYQPPYQIISAYGQQQAQVYGSYPAQLCQQEQQPVYYENGGQFFLQTGNGLIPLPQMGQMNSTILLPAAEEEPPVDIETMTKALQEVSMEVRMKEQMAAAAAADDKTTEEEVPIDPADLENYTPPGTPQELSPVSDQQIAAMVSDLEKGGEFRNQELKQENSKHRRKPEQQHYQPPRTGRLNATRTDSWRSNTSGNSQIQDEQPKSEGLRTPEVKSLAKEENSDSGSNTPTPRATPVPVEQKSEEPPVPMIGGIPLVPVATEQKTVIKTEYCAYCDMIGKPMQTVTNHSLFSSQGIPKCPTFREDGCKICKNKGDRAHLSRYCKKFVEKENTEFKKLGHHLFNLPTDQKKTLVIRDFGNHPKSEQIKTDPQLQEVHSLSLTTLVVKQLKWAQKDRRDFDEEKFMNEHQLSYRSDRRDQRGGSGRGGSRGSFDRGRKISTDRGSNRSGGSRSGKFDGQRSSRSNRGGNQRY